MTAIFSLTYAFKLRGVSWKKRKKKHNKWSSINTILHAISYIWIELFVYFPFYRWSFLIREQTKRVSPGNTSNFWTKICLPFVCLSHFLLFFFFVGTKWIPWNIQLSKQRKWCRKCIIKSIANRDSCCWEQSAGPFARRTQTYIKIVANYFRSIHILYIYDTMEWTNKNRRGGQTWSLEYCCRTKFPVSGKFLGKLFQTLFPHYSATSDKAQSPSNRVWVPFTVYKRTHTYNLHTF